MTGFVKYPSYDKDSLIGFRVVIRILSELKPLLYFYICSSLTNDIGILKKTIYSLRSIDMRTFTLRLKVVEKCLQKIVLGTRFVTRSTTSMSPLVCCFVKRTTAKIMSLLSVY